MPGETPRLFPKARVRNAKLYLEFAYLVNAAFPTEQRHASRRSQLVAGILRLVWPSRFARAGNASGPAFVVMALS
jgi:hypothetical protein